MTIGDGLHKLMVIHSLIHHLLALLKPTLYYRWDIFNSLSRRQIVQPLNQVLFSGFIRVITGRKNLSKENCCQFKKIQLNRPPCISQRVMAVLVDQRNGDSGYNLVLKRITADLAPLHAI